MSILSVSLQGRAGNQTLQWLFAYAFAQKHGMEFRCPEWIGEKLFTLPKYERPPDGPAHHRMGEYHLLSNAVALGEVANTSLIIEFRGYAQLQACVKYYTKRQAQSWLNVRPEVEAFGYRPRYDRIVCHRRAGDYFGYGYPVVSSGSYFDAMEEFGLNPREAVMLCEEEAHLERPPGLPDEISFFPDFYRMIKAKVLLRGNSSFSWLAGLLGNGLVLAPVVDGLEGGKEHHCRFVAGNHPRFANLDFVENLHVAP